MPPIPAKITGVASYVPPKVMTNHDFEKIIDTSDEWIRERTGISTRHVVEKGHATAAMATEASKKLLEQTGTDPEEIGLIVLGTVTPDMFFPSTACLVQNNLGCTRAWGFDISAACSGFVYALTTGAQFAAARTHKKVLVIGADTMTSILNYEDRATCVLFGDGAGAALVEPCEDGEEGILDFFNDIDGSGGCHLYMPGGGSLNPSSHETVDKGMHFVHQNGRNVFKYAVRRMGEVAESLLVRNGFTGEDLKLLIPHQANQRIIDAAARRINIPDEKVVVNISKYGNTTAGTIPLAIVDALEEGRLRKGDLAMLLAVGAGFTTGGVLLRWAY